MSNVFLDANSVFDILATRRAWAMEELRGHTVFFSPLSIHIFSYVYKLKMPQEDVLNGLYHFVPISYTPEIMKSALLGPTKDFEDNVQLHSSVEANADYFLTQDQDLLKMIFFGKMKMVSKLSK